MNAVAQDTDAPRIEATAPAPRRKRPNFKLIAEVQADNLVLRESVAELQECNSRQARTIFDQRDRIAAYRKWQIVLFIVLPVIGAVVGRVVA